MIARDARRHFAQNDGNDVRFHGDDDYFALFDRQSIIRRHIDTKRLRGEQTREIEIEGEIED